MSFTIPTLLAVVATLMLITNIITQVIKKITWDKIPSSLLAFIVAEVITVVAVLAYCSFMSIVILWYYVAGAILLGLFVAFAAMFGFDKFREIVNIWIVLRGK